MPDNKQLQINEQRLLSDLEELSQIGSTDNGGIHRPAFSPAHLAARSWFKQKALQAGLSFQIDRAGNHAAILHSDNKEAKTLLMGSHLDSVPYGGRFDGALGVLSALEILRTLKEENIHLPFNLEAVDFTDEEGTILTFLGSAAVAGLHTPEAFNNPCCNYEKMQTLLKDAGLTIEDFLNAKREPESLIGYLEIHVEQGPKLEQANKDIGIVSEIIGLETQRLTFFGRADHSGTTSMRERRDASLGASRFTLDARELVMQHFPDSVVNIGEAHYLPGAYNIVPYKATLLIEFRSSIKQHFSELRTQLLKCAQQSAAYYNLTVEREITGSHDPVPMSSNMQQLLSNTANELSLTQMHLGSAAGHDAQMLAHICPTGMIFIPSKGGYSHSAREFSSPQDCKNGTNVILQTILQIARQEKKQSKQTL